MIVHGWPSRYPSLEHPASHFSWGGAYGVNCPGERFVRPPRTVLSRDRLPDLVRRPSVHIGNRSIYLHIMRPRRKIKPDPAQPTYIKTVHGIGYCLAGDVTRFKKAS